jgi:uncharacterized protein
MAPLVAAARRRSGRAVTASFLALLLAASARAGVDDAIPAAPRQFVTDRAGVLNAERAQRLSEKLEQFERETSNQILVWVDRRIPENFTLEDFTVRAAQKWRAGQAAKDNGAVLFVFTEDRKLRIEVGYGLEGVLPDATSKRIIEEQIVPRFRAGNYAGGIEAGVEAMMAATKGEYRGSGSTAGERSGRGRGLPSGCAIPFLLLFFFLIFPILASRRRWRTYGGSGWWTGGGGWGSGGGGWGGGGGGGFSGGGGSFGGGGASGSW